MPAIAPPLIPLDPELGLVSAGEEAAAADEAADADVCEDVGDDADDDVADELELLMLEETWPRTCSSRTTPELELQQPLVSPQHHLELVAVPSQGVILAVSFLYVSAFILD